MPAGITDEIIKIAIMAVPIIIAITFHEAAHGYVARMFGDDTAARMGRITFNPLKHIDPFGTILLPGLLLLSHAGFVFGYAKPVPVNFSRLNNPKRDMIWVAAAGPATNIALAAASAILLAISLHASATPSEPLAELFLGSLQINLVLALLNLLPLPPLDGGRVVTGLLPHRLSVPYARIEPYGFFILIGALFLLPILGAKLGVDLNVFDWLIGRPVDWLTHVTLHLIVGM